MADSARFDERGSLGRRPDQDRFPAHQLRDPFPIADAVLQGEKQSIGTTVFDNLEDSGLDAVSLDHHEDQVRGTSSMELGWS